MRSRGTVALVASRAVALALGGCLKRSKMARTYVLDPMPAAGALAAVPAAVVGVDRIDVPDWLDRPQVTGRAASGEVVSDEFSRWAEPLPRGVQRVLAENLVVLLPDRRIVTAPYPPSDRVDQRIEMTVIEAARQADGAVLLEAHWDVIGARGEVLARRRSSHRARPTALGAAGAVAGLNEALVSLSRELADVLRALPLPSK
jgi:uncharacterized lipoprotein YmbA